MNVQFVSTGLEEELYIPPPYEEGTIEPVWNVRELLLENVQFVISRYVLLLYIPAPLSA